MNITRLSWSIDRLSLKILRIFEIVYKKFTKNLADENGSIVLCVTLCYTTYINITYTEEEFSS